MKSTKDIDKTALRILSVGDRIEMYKDSKDIYITTLSVTKIDDDIVYCDIFRIERKFIHFDINKGYYYSRIYHLK